MLLLGVTAMSLLTTPVVIMTSIHFVAKEGHHQVYITGVSTVAPRVRFNHHHPPERRPSQPSRHGRGCGLCKRFSRSSSSSST